MTVIPAAMASAIAGFNASGPDGLMMIALTPLAIRFRMSASWPGASVSRWMMLTLVTLPALTACAFAEQSIASRQPFPTPPALETPIVYLAFAPPPPDAAGVELHAPTTIAATATATRPRTKPIRFIEFHSSLRRPRFPSWVAGRSIIAGPDPRRSVIHLLVARSHGRAAVHALDRR